MFLVGGVLVGHLIMATVEISFLVGGLGIIKRKSIRKHLI